MTIELRALLSKRAALKVETRADGTTHLTGYAAVFYDGTPETQFSLWSGCVERIMPGAFNEALGRDDVRCLFNHEPCKIFGRTVSSTLTLAVDKVGLFYDCTLSESSAEAKSLADSINRGDVSGSSFGFSCYDGFGRSSWLTDKTADGVVIDVRSVESVTLYDVGPATFPAYVGTSCDVAQRSHSSWQKRSRFRPALQRALLTLARVRAMNN